MVDKPLTLLRLSHVMKDNVFKKVRLLHEIVKNGVMDFLVSGESEQDVSGQGHPMIFGADFYAQYNQKEDDNPF